VAPHAPPPPPPLPPLFDISHTQTPALALAMQSAFLALCAKTSAAFLVYYKATWEGNIKMWAHAYLPGVGAYTNGVIESFHGVIKTLFFTSKCVAPVLACLSSFRRALLRLVPRRRSLVGKRIDWLIHVMYTEIFPYYALKTARNTRQADQRAAAVYVHEQLLPAAAAGGRPAAPPLLTAAAGSGAAGAGAETGALLRSSAAAASGAARQAGSLLALFDQAKDATVALLAGGMPPAALASQAALMKTVLRSLKAAAAGSAPAAPAALVAIPGDNSQKRKNPAALGGRSRSYQPRAPPPAGAAPTPLVAAPSTKKRKPTSTMQSLRRKGRADAAGEALAAVQAAKVARLASEA
jgi:hypothetical protein